MALFRHYIPVDRLDQSDEAFADELDRLESVLAQQDAELRRCKAELELYSLYTAELHTALEAQAVQLATLEDRMARLEPPGAAPITPPVPSRPAIRIC